MLLGLYRGGVRADWWQGGCPGSVTWNRAMRSALFSVDGRDAFRRGSPFLAKRYGREQERFFFRLGTGAASFS